MIEPVSEPGAPPVVRSKNPNGRLGRRRPSPHSQGRVIDRSPCSVGIDVSKDRLDVHVRPAGEAFGLPRNAEGLERLVEMIGMESNRKHQAHDARVKTRIQTHLAWPRQALADIDGEIGGQVRRSPVWRKTEELLTSVPGIGKVTALVGVAPITRDSGLLRGHRAIAGGRFAVRSTLYMATLTAIRWNPLIRAHYAQLRDRGRPAKVAIVACMRRLLTILNAMLRERTPWQPA